MLRVAFVIAVVAAILTAAWLSNGKQAPFYERWLFAPL